MSSSVLVQCPHCNAQGNLADPALFGQAISCPVCQQTFVAPTPADQAPPAPAASDPPPPAPADVAAMEPMAAVPPTPDMTASAPPAASPVAADWPAQPTDATGAVSVAAPSAAEAVADVGAATVVAVAMEPAVVTPTPVAEGAVGAAEVVNPSVAEDVCSASTPQPGAVQAMPVAVAVPVATVTMPLPQAYAPGTAPIAPPPAAGMWPVGPAPSEIILPVTGDFLVPERPEMEGPTPAFMAPLPPPGAEEVGFAESLAEPVARGAVKPHKPPSQTLVRVAVASVTVIVLFATVMFLMGDPMRGRKPKLKGPVEENPIAGKGAPPGESIENIFDRINATSKPNDNKGNP